MFIHQIAFVGRMVQGMYYCVQIILGISKIGKKCENISIIKSNSIEFVEMVSIVRIRNKVWQSQSTDRIENDSQQMNWNQSIDVRNYFLWQPNLYKAYQIGESNVRTRERRIPKSTCLQPQHFQSVNMISNGKKAIQCQKNIIDFEKQFLCIHFSKCGQWNSEHWTLNTEMELLKLKGNTQL